MKKKSKENYDFSPETVARKRKFPLFNKILIGILLVAQIVCLLRILFYQPSPQDIIDNYTIFVTPKEDGSLDVNYRFTWTPLDSNEPLTWVEIGMANEYFTTLDNHSDNISKIKRYVDDDGYCYAQIYFEQPYHSGSTLDFYFTVNQKQILATDGTEVFYEFIPGWFNYTQVKHYAFHFYKYGDIASFNGNDQDSHWLIWEGSLDYGHAVRMRVNYNEFDAHTVKYRRFDGDGLYNGLASDKHSSTFMMIFLMAIMFIVELGIIDAYISYHRGRGFLRGYGHPVHTYGRVNPHYTRAANQHRSHSGGGRGCACACACACAGGGRAGCSQKDTYRIQKKKIKEIEGAQNF